MSPDRINHWRNKHRWTVRELVFLLKLEEPKSLESLEPDRRAQFENELRAWREYVRGFSGLSSMELMPLDTPVENRQLLNWVKSLYGVEIPNEWRCLIDENPKGTNSSSSTKDGKSPHNADLGSRERRSLLLIIGALARIGKIDLQTHYASATVIQTALAELGIELAQGTIANHLAKANQEIAENRVGQIPN